MKNFLVMTCLLIAGGCATAPVETPPAPAAKSTAKVPLATRPTKPLSLAQLPPAKPGPVDPLTKILTQRSLDALVYYLVGTWNTIPQEEDQGVSTEMRLRIVRLWPERAGEYWYYWEYVNPHDESKVLRQRIFQLKSDGAQIRSLMYRLPGNPADYVGEWRKPHPFASVDPASLHDVKGCSALWVAQIDFTYAAGTEGDACPGDRPEVRDEHSDFYVTNASIRAWIRGLDASGNQIEGEDGPSEFRKTSIELK